MTLYPLPHQRRHRRSWLEWVKWASVWLLIVSALVMSLVAVSLQVGCVHVQVGPATHWPWERKADPVSTPASQPSPGQVGETEDWANPAETMELNLLELLRRPNHD